jgi:uncharacterized radical SAM superfamily protein
MRSADTPEKLLALGKELKEKGTLGVLVSGGCSTDGSIPLRQFMPTLAQLKNEIGLSVFVHTGTVDKETASQLKKAHIDAALIDIIGSNETIREIYNLKTTVQDYEDSLKALSQAGVNFVPHVVAGLHYGELKGELNALNMIKSFRPSAIVIISFMPIRGTAMAKTKPPAPTEIARVIAVTRSMFPKTPLVLGCMRPKGRHRTETDILALQTGVDGIAFPSKEAIDYAQKTFGNVGFSRFCCAQICKDLAAT